MKLLLDENLSRKLVAALNPAFPGTSQVSFLGLERASDADIFTYARTSDYVIVTKDSDFAELSALHGIPPQILFLQIGNASNERIQALILARATEIANYFSANPAANLVLY